jgi:hypothetical protein
MKRILIDRGGILFVLLMAGIAAFYIYDSAHPELWGDFKHNPCIYGPLALVVAVVGVGIFISGERMERRHELFMESHKRKMQELEALRKMNRK